MNPRTGEPLFDAAHWRRLRELAERLDALDEQSRARELEQLAATEPHLAEQVRALLAQDAHADVEALRAAVQRTLPQAPAQPERIGPFVVLRRLGAGGMGVVYLGERDTPEFTQRVALKLLDGDAARVAQLAARERRVLASLSHPNITAFVDAGTQDERAWLAMEYVEGEPLLAFCAAHALDTRARVAVFDQVCAAVAHAHAQLIVHRDLKPSNVLVANDGTVKLLDFGIARMLDASDEQTPATRVFTPEYAAPEQLRGERATTATDVYALGLMLYELVSGRRLPTLERTTDADWTTITLARHATATDTGTTLPAFDARALRGDLGRIIAHALAADPAQRYGTVAQLRADLKRWLEHRPLTIARPGLRYVAARFVRRNRAAVAVAALLLVAIIVGMVGMAWEARVAKQQATRAIAVKNFLVGLFDDSRNTRAGMQVRSASALDILNAGAERLKADLGDQPEVRDELYTMLVEIFDSSGDGARSQALARERLAAVQAAFGSDDARVAPALTMLAGVLTNHGEFAAAKSLLARSQALLDHASDFDSLERARLWTFQGYLQMREQPADAKFENSPLGKAVELLRRRYPKSDDFDVALFNYANLALATGHLAQGEKAAIEMRDNAVAKHGANTVYVTQANYQLTKVLLKESKFDQALALSKDVVNGFQNFESDAHPDVLFGQRLRILALLGLHRMDEARTEFAKADAVRRNKFASNANLKRVYDDLAAKIDTGNVP